MPSRCGIAGPQMGVTTSTFKRLVRYPEARQMVVSVVECMIGLDLSLGEL